MRVLQVLPSVVSGGGAEQSLAMVAPLLVERGVELHLAVLDGRGDLLASLEHAGVVAHDLSSAGSWPWRVRALRSLVRHLRPDVVHSTLFWADMSARAATIGSGAALLTTWANTSYDPVRRRLEPGAGGWKREVVRIVDLVTAHASRSWYHAVTEGVALDGRQALHVAADRVMVVERGRDLTRFVPPDPAARASTRTALGYDDDVVVVLCVARQSHQKGHLFLLEAFDALGADRPELRLLLVGPHGSASDLIVRRISTSPHPERIVDLGGRDDVVDLLGAADVFVLPSVAEGAAGAIIEAMAVGVPVVTSHLAGFEGWLDGRHAALATPGDAADLARAIGSALDDPAAAAARVAEAHHLVESRFSLDRCADEMTVMYQSVCRRRHAP